MSELPSGWADAPLSQIVEINPVADKKSIPLDADVNFVPMPAVEAETGAIDVSETRRFAKVKTGYTPFEANDVLFAKITPCMENGKMAVVPELPCNLGFGSTEFHVLRSPEGVLPKFVYHRVSSLGFRYDAEHNMTGAVGQKRVPEPYLSSFHFSLPPTNEQRRIVEKIELLFELLDKGEESLRAARDKAGLYRQSLLKHAFEGHLTADWRAANPGKLEDPETLLTRIQEERDARYKQALDDWQDAVAKWRAEGEEGKKPAKPKRPRKLSSLANSLEQQSEKLTVELGDLVSVSSGAGLTSAQMNGGQYPVYGGNGIAGRHDQYIIEEPTLIIGRVGAKCGVTHITHPKSWVTDNALVVTQLVDSFDQNYFRHLLAFKNLNALGSSTGQPVISGAKIYPVEIILPTLAEQTEIVSRLEAKLSTLDALEADIDAQLVRSRALRQSILKRAFEGNLVPQDPTDEPASALLARIKAERDAAPKPKRKRKTPA